VATRFVGLHLRFFRGRHDPPLAVGGDGPPHSSTIALMFFCEAADGILASRAVAMWQIPAAGDDAALDAVR
jgi:hypothetical protein